MPRTLAMLTMQDETVDDCPVRNPHPHVGNPDMGVF